MTEAEKIVRAALDEGRTTLTEFEAKKLLAGAGLPTARSLALGNQHSCAALADGTLHCWGYNESRQLGHGARGDQATPVAVQNLTDVTGAAAGYGHTCAVRADGQVYCWGSASRGQLGRGHRAQPTPQPLESPLADLSPSPSTVHTFPAAPSPVVQITPHAAVGTGHVCAVVGSGEVACFGQGGDGRLGHGSTRPLASDSEKAPSKTNDMVSYILISQPKPTVTACSP